MRLSRALVETGMGGGLEQAEALRLLREGSEDFVKHLREIVEGSSLTAAAWGAEGHLSRMEEVKHCWCWSWSWSWSWRLADLDEGAGAGAGAGARAAGGARAGAGVRVFR
mmetsp:Transcript_7885/g.12534  ORF Transcript_7885/g.12534 Transcript_7885/m.12534 type:complete len:110 (-) Transcript_7885:57-386(-)